MSWQKPSDKYPKCGSYMVEKGNRLVCSGSTCGYVEKKKINSEKFIDNCWNYYMIMLKYDPHIL